MREGLAGQRIGVGPDIGFGDQIADRIVRESLGDADADRRRGQPVEGNVGGMIGFYLNFWLYLKDFYDIKIGVPIYITMLLILSKITFCVRMLWK